MAAKTRPWSIQRLGNQLLSRYRFGHILFQAYLYNSLDRAERAYLHEAVGHTLEQLAAEHTGAVAAQLAHHFQVAGLWAKAIDYLRDQQNHHQKIGYQDEFLQFLQTYEIEYDERYLWD